MVSQCALKAEGKSACDSHEVLTRVVDLERVEDCERALFLKWSEERARLLYKPSVFDESRSRPNPSTQSVFYHVHSNDNTSIKAYD